MLVQTASVIVVIYSTVNRDDVPVLNNVVESSPLKPELLSTNRHIEDHSDRCIVEGSVHRNCRPSTEDIVFPEQVIDDSSCSLSAEKVKKLKLMHRGKCRRYNEVRLICATHMNLM